MFSTVSVDNGLFLLVTVQIDSILTDSFVYFVPYNFYSAVDTLYAIIRRVSQMWFCSYCMFIADSLCFGK